jgi:hypothetical protein
MSAVNESASDVADGARSRHRSAIGWFVGDESQVLGAGAQDLEYTVVTAVVADRFADVGSRTTVLGKARPGSYRTTDVGTHIWQ